MKKEEWNIAQGDFQSNPKELIDIEKRIKLKRRLRNILRIGAFLIILSIIILTYILE